MKRILTTLTVASVMSLSAVVQAAENLPLTLLPEAGQAAMFTVKNANNDDVTWVYDLTRKAFHYAGNKNLAADDWLFLPLVNIVDTTMFYELEFDSWVTPYKFSIATARDFNKVEAYLGNSADPASMNLQILPTVTVKTDSTDMVTPYARFRVNAPGVYCIGIRVVSDKNKKYLNVNNFRVRQSRLSTRGPKAIDDIKATAGTNGALNATVEFTMPSKDSNDSDLVGNVTVKISTTVDEKSVSGAPGSRHSVTVNTPQSKTNNLSVITLSPSCGGFLGIPSETSLWTGVDIPGNVSGVTITADETNMGATISWNPITTGQKNGYVDPSQINYHLYQKGTLVWSRVGLLGKNITSAKFGVKEDSDQKVMNMTVVGENGAGFGNPVGGYLEALGKPIELPAREKYTSASGGSYPQLVVGYNGAKAPSFGYKDPAKVNADYADESVPFAYTAVCAANSTGLIRLPKFSTKGARSVVFMPKIYRGSCENLVVKVRAFGMDEVEIFNLANEESTAATGYQSFTIALPEQFQDKNWVQVCLYPQFTAEKPNFILAGYDMLNMVDNDICVKSVTAPHKATVGSKYEVDVTYTNIGMKAINNYTVELFDGTTLIGTFEGHDLAPDSVASHTFEVLMSPLAKEDIKLCVKATCPADANPDNNVSEEVSVSPAGSPLPVAVNLRAVCNADGNSLNLSWDKPDMTVGAPSEIVESFEDAAPFATKFGNWEFVDVDRKPVGGFKGIDIPGITVGASSYSYGIWNAEQLGNSTFKAHSGTQYLFSMACYDRTACDDWAISPRLSGLQQTVSFYARSYASSNPETIEILYSTGSTEPSDFVKVENIGGVVPNTWTLYKVDLPSGARRFAIRKCSENAGMLMVDDVTMTIEPAVSDDLELTGYDVYRDGRKVNEALLPDSAFNDKDVTEGSTYGYQVVAVYNKGMSGPSETLSTIYTPSGTDLPEAGRIVAGKGFVRIEGFEGQTIHIFGADGLQLGSCYSDGSEIFNLPAGIYIVKTTSTVVKVHVR